jgi:Tfp pilus assembly protein PilO
MVSDMTSTRNWVLGAVAAALVLLVGGWFLLISPKRAEVADLQTQTQAAEAANSQKATQLEVLKQQNKDLPEKQAELAALEEKIPTNPDMPTYIRELQSMASNAGVTLSGMAPAAAVTVGAGSAESGVALTPDAMAAINLDLTLSGPYEGIQKFVNDLESSERYTLSTGLTIAQEDSQSTSGKKSSDLTATVNARIFYVPQAAEVDGAQTTTPSTTPTPAP